MAAVVLAAGSSRRMGKPKLLLRWGNSSLLRRAAEAALQAADRVVVVVGPDPDRMRQELAGLPVEVVVNPDHAQGLASSLRCGLRTVPDAPAVLVTLADQPRVTGEHLRRLVEAYRDTEAPVVAASYAGTAGVPAVFRRDLFGELVRLRGDSGARPVIERHRDEAVLVPVPEAAVDVDTPEDWARLTGG
ncbi:MAG: nucleotidyltransferase family protein [Armatimonadota bacterium]|nr:nucleotidyltransferase family protein [Armatimonadota bacterium]MDW8155997.1 nucleotidyltransferase family protein [Armatimonadota bacterium]